MSKYIPTAAENLIRIKKLEQKTGDNSANISVNQEFMDKKLDIYVSDEIKEALVLDIRNLDTHIEDNAEKFKKDISRLDGHITTKPNDNQARIEQIHQFHVELMESMKDRINKMENNFKERFTNIANQLDKHDNTGKIILILHDLNEGLRQIEKKLIAPSEMADFEARTVLNTQDIDHIKAKELVALRGAFETLNERVDEIDNINVDMMSKIGTADNQAVANAGTILDILGKPCMKITDIFSATDMEILKTRISSSERACEALIKHQIGVPTDWEEIANNYLLKFMNMTTQARTYLKGIISDLKMFEYIPVDSLDKIRSKWINILEEFEKEVTRV